MNADINWSVSGDVECPNCEEVNDFMEVDEWWNYCQIAENKEFKKNHPVINCNGCGHEIHILNSNY